MKIINKTEFPSEIEDDGKVYLPSNRFIFHATLLVISPEDFQRVVIVQTPDQQQKIYEESTLSVKQENLLRYEIKYIFESGANEIRIFEMVRRFFN